MASDFSTKAIWFGVGAVSGVLLVQLLSNSSGVGADGYGGTAGAQQGGYGALGNGVLQSLPGPGGGGQGQGQGGAGQGQGGYGGAGTPGYGTQNMAPGPQASQAY